MSEPASETRSKEKIQVVFLWHMHQPYYKDLVTGTYRLPWARLHALKDYYGMVAMLEEFPGIHQTFNLVPSLLLQLEEYAAGTAREPWLEIAFKPVRALTQEDRLFLLQYFFQANLQHLISRYPRYRQLYDNMQANDFVAERAIRFFRENDFADLQVLSQLAWFDEIFLANDPEIKALVSKGQNFSRADQELLQSKEREAIRKVLEAYRRAAERGQIEISTSPFYHPILPLLCDTNVAAEAHPGVRLPNHRFRHAEDARLQLERAIELHRRIFEQTPRGLWPSEGSVSEQVLEICASLGFHWIATDQQILANSIDVPFFRDPAGVLANADRLYSPYVFGTSSGPIQMLFRDHELSDRIGFVYAHVEAESAATDLLGRIKQSALPLLRQGKRPVVSLILDGENAWEYYPKNGRPFLRALYRLFSEDSQIECPTVSEAIERHDRLERLPRLTPGSWINANFDIWIGAEEDNQAWEYLWEARDFFECHQANSPAAKRDLALEELLAAEGSDWCWWYGPEHSSANDGDFDELYRSHLANVYQALGEKPPEVLARPIRWLRQQAVATSPVGAISPCIDGAVTSYFEWMGAGYYSPIRQGGTMHGRAAIVKEVHYGRNSANFFLRVDFTDSARNEIGRFKLRIMLRGAKLGSIVVSFSRQPTDQKVSCEIRREEETAGQATPLGEAVMGKILEMQIDLGAIGVGANQPFDFQVTVWENNFPRETLPLEGWLMAPAPVLD